MEYLDWSQEICRVAQDSKFMGAAKRIGLYELPLEVPIALPSQLTLREASKEFLGIDAEAALVQDLSGTILGVLRRDALHAAIVTADSTLDAAEIRRIMDRKLCVESEISSACDAITRMTLGACAHLLVVDERGIPRGLLTPRSLLRALGFTLPDVSYQHSAH